MSERKPNGTPNEEESKDLVELLDRLERRDEAQRRRRNAPSFGESVPELIVVEEADPNSPEENMYLHIDRFQPTSMTEEDLQELLITGVEDDTYDEEGEDLPSAPKKRRNPFVALWEGFCDNIPRKEDSTGTKWRKGGFLFSLLVMLVAVIYLAVDLLIIPAHNENLKNELIELYNPEDSQVVMSNDGNYPKYMLASFRELYDRNSDVRGWISYHADGKSDFLDIEYPIVYRDVEDTTNPYLKMDFDGNKNRNGTLYFDQSSRLESPRDKNRVLIVYGHNMASGQMFAGLNKFMGNVNNARAAATLTMSTLFREDAFKVFAVILVDESDEVKERRYDAWETAFTSDVAFLDHIEAARARSLFDYPVDVEAEDQILVLSTCTGKTSAHVKDGRLVVMARRVRDGESATVNTNEIVKNTDVIMPYYWYINQNKTVHQYYVDQGVDYPTQPNLTTKGSTTTTTAGKGATTTATTGSGTTTAGSGTAGTTRPTSAPTSAPTVAPSGSTTVTTAPTVVTPTESTAPTASTAPTESTVPTETGPTETTPTESTAPTETEPTETAPTETTSTTETTETEPTETQPTETEPTSEPTDPTTTE